MCVGSRRGAQLARARAVAGLLSGAGARGGGEFLGGAGAGSGEFFARGVGGCGPIG